MTEKHKTYKRAIAIYGSCAVLMLFMAALFSENFGTVAFMLMAVAFSAIAGVMFGCAALSGEFDKKEGED